MSKQRRQIGLKGALITFSVALVLAFGGILAQSAYRTYRQIVGDAATAADSIARSAETGTERTILSIDAMLVGIGQTLASTYRDAPIDGPEVRAMLRRTKGQTLSVCDILIVDENRRQVNGSASPFAPSDYVGHELVTAHSADGQPSLFISRPQDSRSTGNSSIFMSRPFSLADGTHGIIVAEV